MRTGKVLLGVLAGATVGALAGVLFAPHRGKVTRKKIYRSGGVLADDVKEKFDEFIDSVTEKISKAKDNVADFAEQRMAKSNEQKKQSKTS